MGEKEIFRHIVLFKFKEGVSSARVEAVEQAFVALSSQIETIVDFEWGLSNSIEGKNEGFTHCFFVSFRDKAGLEAYLPHPAHMDFKVLLADIVEKVLVFDYSAR